MNLHNIDETVCEYRLFYGRIRLYNSPFLT